jgi:uncharacterized repeat protein (TIGR01451 family)
MKRSMLALAALAAMTAAGCETQDNRSAYNDEGGRQERLVDREGNESRVVAGEQRAEQRSEQRTEQRSEQRDTRRVDASARTRGEGERQGERTRFTMAYPTGDRQSSVLLVEKTVPNQVRLNAPFQYDIKVTNITDATLDDVRIREETPEGLNITASQPERQGQGEQQGWAIGALKPKESRTIQVSAVAQKQGQLGTCVMASYQPSLCSAINVVNPQLTVTKRAPERVDICEELVWEYSVTNSGTGATEPVIVREQLPEGLTTQNGNNVVEMDAGSIREGQTKTGRVKLKAAKPGEYRGKAVASSAGGLQAESAETNTVVIQPRLGINIEGPESEYVDRPIAYRVTVTNEGDAPARDAVAIVAVPGGSKVVNVGTEGRAQRDNIQWALGTLEPKASKTLTFTMSATEAANFSTVARASAVCAPEVNDTAQTRIITIPALVLEAVDLSDPTRVGDNVVYRITVQNQGSGPDNNIRVTARLPAEMQYVSAKGSTEATAEGQAIRFAPVQTLAPGRSAQWELTAKGNQAGDVRFEVQLESESLTKPVNENESTRLY